MSIDGTRHQRMSLSLANWPARDVFVRVFRNDRQQDRSGIVKSVSRPPPVVLIKNYVSATRRATKNLHFWFSARPFRVSVSTFRWTDRVCMWAAFDKKRASRKTIFAMAIEEKNEIEKTDIQRQIVVSETSRSKLMLLSQLDALRSTMINWICSAARCFQTINLFARIAASCDD